MVDFRSKDAAAPVVVMVKVDVAPGLAGVTGFVEKALAALHDGAGDPPPLTLHARVTCWENPFNAVRVTVDVPEVPGFTAVGVVAAIAKSAAVADPKAVMKASGQGTFVLPDVHVPPPKVPSTAPVVVGKTAVEPPESVSPVT